MARKILLADDSVTAQNMGRKILSDAGYEVITVNNGSAALKKIAEGKPDLIVLDVYMPGYSGLEVCQRLKEIKETARIPILLTVGKLEPFKPEEARRVRADAFIVKPFEASELLTALAKLEDKIVPQAEAFKPGRFAKAIAAVEQFNSETGDRFGDADSGWKERIKFPSGTQKPPEPEPEVPVSSASLRNGVHDEQVKPVEASSPFERPIPAGLPPDITPEEIAAITAAAAQLAGSGQSAPVRSEAVSSETKPAAPETSEPPEPVATEAAPATLAGAPEAQAQEKQVEEPAPAVKAESPRAEVARTEEAIPSREAAPAQAAAASAQAEITKAKTEEAAREIPQLAEATPAVQEPAGPGPVASTADPEVLAALQALAPSNGNNSWAQTASPTEKPEDVPATVAAPTELVAMGARTAGPRWIAEEAALDSQEAKQSLENEMQKAHAAFAAAESARASLASASAAMAAPSAAVEVAAAGPAGTPPGIPEAAVEPITTKESEPPPPGSTPGSAATVEPPALAVAIASSETPGSFPKEEATAAVAAAGSSSTGEWRPAPESSFQPPPSTAPPETTSAAHPDEPDRQREAELDAATAAAWANWKQIRNSIVGPELTSQIVDAAAAGLKETRPGEPSPAKSQAAAQPEAAEGSSFAPAADPTAIASIVDSVLAELKPKLVEEIARKMSTDGEKKKKKKKD